MHVLVLPKWYPGPNDPQLGDFIRKQMQAVSAHHRISVLYPCPMAEMAEAQREELHEENGLWELYCFYRPHTSSISPVRRAVNYLRYRRALRRGVGRLLRERGRPELVHANVLTRPVYAAWRLASRWNIPFVVSEHSSEHLNGNWRRKHFLARTLDRFLMRRAAAITAVSPLLAEALRKAGLGRKIEVVPNVVPGLDQELPKSGPASNFLVVADLVDRTKNVSGVLRAMALVHAQGHPFRLEVIGDGPDGEALRALAATLGIDGHVHWHGRLPQREVLPVMALTGTVIINSNHETFSVVTGEALASGKPVIATRCGGPEAFITSANGMLVPIGDDTALAAAMISMAARHAEFPPAQVRASIDDRYTATAVGLRIDQTYRNALAHG